MLEVDRELWAIEVKAGSRIDCGSLSGLLAFAERTRRVKRKIVVFLGPRKQSIEGVEILPLLEFVEELPA